MNIGIDATALYGRYGGVEYALWNLLCALNVGDGDTRYTVYVPHDGPPPAHLQQFSARWRWIRLPFDGSQKARRILWQQLQLPRQLLRDHCDVLHAPTYIAPSRSPVPVVLTVYDLIALSHPQYATLLNRLHYGVLLPRSIMRARRVIVPTEAVRQELSGHLPLASARTCVVPLGVEPIFLADHDATTRSAIRARYGLPERYLLFVGNFEPKKNLHNVLRALPKLQLSETLPLVIAGGMRAWSGYTIQEILSEAGLEPTSPGDESSSSEKASTPQPEVMFPGYVRRRDLPVLYSMCEAFIFPSLAEGFGLPVLEALASGAPVVTSRAVPLPGVEEVALLCDAYDAASIATQIQRILDDASLREQLQRAGRAYARPFTWRRAAEMTMDVYQQTVSRE